MYLLLFHRDADHLSGVFDLKWVMVREAKVIYLFMDVPQISYPLSSAFCPLPSAFCPLSYFLYPDFYMPLNAKIIDTAQRK